MTLAATLKKTRNTLEKALIGEAGGEKDILDQLKEEHEEVAELLERLVKSQRAGERKSLLAKIKAALVPHLRAEEKVVYDAVGIDWQEARAAIMEAFGDAERREAMKQSANIFRVLIKTLLNAGIITERTRAFYGMYVDMDALKHEGDRMIGDDIAEQGIAYLQAINFGETAKGRALLAAE